MPATMLPDQYDPEIDPQEAARQAGAMLRTGTVAAVSHKRACVRFRTGGITTDWIPWIERRAGGKPGGCTWWPPVVGEQGLLLAPGGDLTRAVVLPGIFSTAMPASERAGNVARTDWNETDFCEWRAGLNGGEARVACAASITLVVGGSSITITRESITLEAGGASLTLAGGIVSASRDVVAGGISLTRHVHGGVKPGPSNTGGPR